MIVSSGSKLGVEWPCIVKIPKALFVLEVEQTNWTGD
jgi:hypothetical protein